VLNVQSISGSTLSNWIGGRWREARKRATAKSYNPTTGQPWYEFPDSDHSDVEDAVAAAWQALRDPKWARLTQTERANLMRSLAELIRANVDRLAEIEVQDNGKLLREMKAQIGILPDQFHYFAGAADKLEGATIPINRRDVLSYTVREPLGVVAIITPWNSPLYQLSWTLGPALAAGNTVVVKPSEHTTASALALAGLMEQAGFPPGVFNVVCGFGDSAGNALTSDTRVAKIAFTGSAVTGRKVARNAAEHFAQCNLELGGKSPNCIFDDAPLDRALNGVIAGIFAAGGQTCVAGSRIYIQRSIYDRFVDMLVEKTRSIRLGNPTSDATQMGPVAVHSQLEKIRGMVDAGLVAGARLITGGRRAQGDLSEGWFYEPTLLDNAAHASSIVQEEIFGPVATIAPFADESELIGLANGTPYGLTAGVWTSNVDRALRFANQVEAGTIWVNTYRAASFTTPMGGFKASGYGKHYGLESMREYSRVKSVMIDYSGATQDAFVMNLKENR
jgi:(Z)-2-((N-methylformamido)methylene)-5-hydroxybutyrolactone dehydrogenase